MIKLFREDCSFLLFFRLVSSVLQTRDTGKRVFVLNFEISLAFRPTYLIFVPMENIKTDNV